MNTSIPNGKSPKGDFLTGSSPFDSQPAWLKLRDPLPSDFTRWTQVLRKNWMRMASIIAVCILLTGLYAQRQPRVYAARAVLQVDQQQPKVLNKIENINEGKLDTDDVLKTVVQLLGSDSLMLQVVRANGLEKDTNFAPPKPHGERYLDSELAALMHRKVSISLRRETRLIDASVEDTVPARAATLANSLVNEFLRQTYEANSAQAKVANEFLFGQAERLRSKLEASEQKLQQYRETHQAVSLEDKQNITVERLKDLNTKVTTARSDRVKLEADLSQIERAGGNIDSLLQVGAVAALPQVAEVRSQLIRAESDFAAVQRRYLRAHPKYIAALTLVDDLKRALAEAVRRSGEIVAHQYQAAKDLEGKLGTALSEQESKALELTKIAIPYNVLVREAESDRLLYDNIVTRLKETGLSERVEQAPYHIVEAAMVPANAVRPQKAKMLLIALFGGSALAVGFVTAREACDTTLQSAGQAEKALELPLLAIIPKGPVTRKPDGCLLLSNSPDSAAAESFRTLRTSLSLLPGSMERQTFLLTSAMPAEGKSFCVLNCAVAFAQQGLGTLIIDANLRHPSIFKTFFQDGPAPGLTDVLTCKVAFKDAVRKTHIERLSLLGEGCFVNTPVELLGGDGFAQLIKEAMQKFDRIIIDSAPVNGVSDTLLLAKHAQAVCLVVSAAQASGEAVLLAERKLIETGTMPVGFIFNRASDDADTRYAQPYRLAPRADTSASVASARPASSRAGESALDGNKKA